MLGKTYSEAMKNYSAALQEFDDLIAEHRREPPLREAVLEIVRAEFGEQAMRDLARGSVDENLDFALQDLSAKVEHQVSPEVSAAIHSGVVPEMRLTLSECLDRHLLYKLSGDAEKDRLPRNHSDRSKRYLIETLGSTVVEQTPIEQVTRQDANRFRDALLGRMKPNSVVRLMNVVVAAINFAITEEDLPIKNVFSKMVIKGAGASKDDRLPIQACDIPSLNKAFDTPEDISAIWATIRDTGARLSEVCLLTVGDISLQDKSISFRPNNLRSKLKTASSERTIPLSDDALNKLQALRIGKEDDEAIFPRYARPRGSDSCSQTMMKRFRKVVDNPKISLHSARHALKDALRNSNCQEELAKQILGHSDGSVASRYGSGYDINTMRDALVKVW